jgi:hypothetical protein
MPYSIPDSRPFHGGCAVNKVAGSLLLVVIMHFEASRDVEESMVDWWIA